VTRRLLRAAAPLALAATALVAASACDSAVPAQSKEHSTTAGVNSQVGSVLIRNAGIVVDQGGTSGRLDVALVNQGTAPDQLLSITSPAATFALPSTATASEVQKSVTATPTSPAAPQVSSSTASATVAAPGEPVQLLAGTAVFLDKAGTSVVITHIDQPLRIGNELSITFTFAAAGTLTLSVPVVDSTVPQAGGLQTASPAVTKAGVEGGEVPSESETPFAASTTVQPTTTAPTTAAPPVAP